MSNPKIILGFTQIPNDLIEDGMARINLSPNESKIVWTIMRKTFGWHKDRDAISISQFAEATGLDRRHVQRSLKTLVARNIISKWDGHINAYAMQMDCSRWKVSAANNSACIGHRVAPIQATPLAPDLALTKQIINYTKREGKNVSFEESAGKIYEAYPKKVNETLTLKSIINLLQSGQTEESLLRAVANYKKDLRKNGTREKYIIHSHNFFGQAGRYKEFLATPVIVNPIDLGIQRCIGQGNYLMNRSNRISLLRPDEVAKALGITVDTVYKWCGRGLLPHYRLEKCIRFKLEDVQEFLTQRRIESLASNTYYNHQTFRLLSLLSVVSEFQTASMVNIWA